MSYVYFQPDGRTCTGKPVKVEGPQAGESFDFSIINLFKWNIAKNCSRGYWKCTYKNNIYCNYGEDIKTYLDASECEYMVDKDITFVVSYDLYFYCGFYNSPTSANFIGHVSLHFETFVGANEDFYYANNQNLPDLTFDACDIYDSLGETILETKTYSDCNLNGSSAPFTTIDIPDFTPEKLGYYFFGWATSPLIHDRILYLPKDYESPYGIDYATALDGQLTTSSRISINQNTTLYAIWVTDTDLTYAEWFLPKGAYVLNNNGLQELLLPTDPTYTGNTRQPANATPNNHWFSANRRSGFRFYLDYGVDGILTVNPNPNSPTTYDEFFADDVNRCRMRLFDGIIYTKFKDLSAGTWRDDIYFLGSSMSYDPNDTNPDCVTSIFSSWI